MIVFNVIKKCISLLVIMALINGCSYSKKIVPPGDVTEQKQDNAKYVLAIYAPLMSTQQVIASPGRIKLNVERGDALYASIKNNLSKYYRDVYVVSDKKELKKYDQILNLREQTVSNCGGQSCSIVTSLTLNIKKDIGDSKNLLTEDFVDQYVWQEPGSVVALAVLTGLLLPIAIITGPSMTNMCGDELYSQVNMSNDRIAARVKEIVTSSNLLD